LIGALALPTECYAAQWVTNIAVTQVVAGNSAGEYAQPLMKHGRQSGCMRGHR